jgi:hypothetical protein
MSDEELVKRLRDKRQKGNRFDSLEYEAADRIEALTAEVGELQEVFDFQWRANMRAVEIWRTANPGNDLVLPDSAKLTVWLLERTEALEAERDQWIAHTKNAVWSDSEELKLTEAKLAECLERNALLEARLGKAVELLTLCRDMFDEVAHPSDPLSRMLNDDLAEIEGEKI